MALPLLCDSVCLGDVGLLGGLVASAEQEDEPRPILEVVDSVSGSVVDSQFRDAVTDRSTVAGVARCEPVDPDQHPGSRVPVFEFRIHWSKTALLTTSTMCQL